MKLERSKNAVRNMTWGFVYRVVSLVGPFIVRTVFIKTLGKEYLGVNGLFSSVLSVLSLAELGIGSAIVFSMYKAIADDNDTVINALLYFYKKTYRYIGFILLVLGLAVVPFLHLLAKEDYPQDINPEVVYIIFLVNTVLSYFLFAYLNSLFEAFQRTDINTVARLYINVIMYIIQIVLLINVKDYYIYILIMPIFTVITNIRVYYIAKKIFPQYKPAGKISEAMRADIREKVGGLMIQQLCVVSRNAFDSIFISVFLGFSAIGIYNNYYYIMNSVTGFMSILVGSVLAGVGNSVTMESKEKNYSDMMKMYFIYMWISGWCCTCLLVLFQPFMEIWVGSDLMLPNSSVYFLCIYFYCLKLGDINGIYSNANGMWWKNRIRSLVEAITNIILNYYLGKFFGINGIILATIIPLFVFGFICGTRILFKNYYTGYKMGVYFRFHFVCASVVFVTAIITYFACYYLPSGYIYIFLKMVICLLIPNLIYFLVYKRSNYYREAMPWLLDKIGFKKECFIRRILLGKESNT